MRVVGGVVRSDRATNSNIACQITILFQGAFPTICSTRGIDNAISTWPVSTRLYNIPRSRESVLSDIREGRLRAAGSFASARMRLSTKFLVTIYVSKECRPKRLGHACNSSS
jgi:hypothetical protein